jgi:hypothetical protein
VIVTPQLRNGESLTGQPLWWDLGAIDLQPVDAKPRSANSVIPCSIEDGFTTTQ